MLHLAALDSNKSAVSAVPPLAVPVALRLFVRHARSDFISQELRAWLAIVIA